MHFWTAMVIFAALSALVSIVRAKHGVSEDKDGGTSVLKPENDRLHGEVRQLKDRIQVLERIVTDSDHNRGLALSQEIEQLRDRRRDAQRDPEEAR